MPKRTSGERTYSEEEVRALLSRAIERQEADRHAAHDHGLTLEEIQRVAAEVGVDPKYVTAAAAALEQGAPPSDRGSKLAGGPLRASFTRTVDGALTDETSLALARTIRKAFKQDRGHLEVIGASFDWTSSNNSGENIHVHAYTEEGRTYLEVSQKFETYLVLFHMMGAFPLFFVVAGLLTGKFAMAGLAASLATLLYFVARYGYGVATRRRSKKLEALTEQLAGLIEEKSALAAASPQTTAAQTMSPLLDVEEAEEQAASAQTQRRERA